MNRNFIILVVLLINTLIAISQPAITSVILPQYMADTTKSIGQGPRTPFVFRAKLTGLTANATYRYITKAISLYYLNGSTPSYDIATSAGAGNPIYIHQNGGFAATSNPSFVTFGGYDSLVSNAAGEYEGWFGMEPTGNARFASGNYFHPRIIINNGVTGNTTTFNYLTISDSVRTISYGTSLSQGSGIRSRSLATDKNMAILWDNVSATGRPLSIAIIESDGITFKSAGTPTNYPLFYRNFVDSVSGAWGTMIPNDNSNGVRRIDNRNLSNGALVFFNTDADGIWTTGAVSTVNPSAGYVAIKLDSNDAPLVPGPNFYFEKTAYLVNETGISISVGVKNKNPVFASTNVTVAVKVGGTATSGSDYSFVTSNLTFSTSDTLKTINIPISDDLLIEGNETIILRLMNPGNGGNIGSDSVSIVTIIDDDFPLPVATFLSSKQTVSEWNTTSLITVKLSAPAPKAVSVNVIASNGTASSGDYSFTNVTLNFAVGDSIKTVSVTIVDDLIQEAPEYFLLQLTNPVTATIGIATDTIFISDNDYQRLPLGQISTVNVSTGIADSLGKKYDEVGVVYGINYRPAGLQFVIRDNSGGITVFKSAGNYGYLVKEGDSIRTLGTVAQFNGLTEFNADTILVLGNKKPLKSPTIITKLTENNENDLVRLNDLQFDIPIATWPTTAANVSVHNTTDTIIIRLQAANVDILGTATPQGTFDVIGLGSQFDNSNPYTSGYQLFPRFLSDIIPTAPPATVAVDTVTITVGESIGNVTFKFKINNVNGNATTVNLDQTGTALPGLDYTAPSSNVTFPSTALNGDSILVTYTIIDDAQVESSETIQVNINPSFNAIVIGKSKTIIITDNDVAPVKFTIDSFPISVNENVGLLKVKVRISNVNGRASSASINLSGTAINSVDYIASPTTINFPASAVNGDSIMIAYAIVDDAVYEPGGETIISTYVAGTNAIMNGGVVQVITVNDNDPNGLHSSQSQIGLQCFPNPSAGNVTIIAPVKIAQLQLIDFCGRVVLKQFPNSNEVVLNQLIPGIFVLQVQIEGRVITLRLVVN